MTSGAQRLDDQQVMHALSIDDAYTVDRVLASGPGGVTEIVSIDGTGPYVRKRIPARLARRGVWATVMECTSGRLPRVVATYEMPDEFVVICDYVPGQNLEQVVAARGRMAEKDACKIVSELCDAVGALHEHGIIHRDISPANVIVAADGAHLIDLGIARFRTEGAAHDTTQLGTRGFASPEQCGYAQTDARSDVYSLGRILGYLLTGVRPQTPDTAEYRCALADGHMVRPEMRAIVERASAMEPSARYQSAGALAAALAGKATADEATPPSGPSLPGPREATVRRGGSWAKVLLAATAVISIVAAVALAILNSGLMSGKKDATAPTASEPAASAPESDSSPELEGQGDGASAALPASSLSALEIVESGWSVDSSGYVHYAFELRNPNDIAVELPGVRITGRDKIGNVLFSQEQYLCVIGPGEAGYFGTLAGGGEEAPATVEFEPLQIEDYQMGTAESAPSFSVSNVSVSPGSYGEQSVTGDVSTVRDDGTAIGGNVAVTVVLRDESGAIVFGETDYARRPDVGESTPFEVTLRNAPDYATCEVYAQAW